MASRHVQKRRTTEEKRCEEKRKEVTIWQSVNWKKRDEGRERNEEEGNNGDTRRRISFFGVATVSRYLISRSES